MDDTDFYSSAPKKKRFTFTPVCTSEICLAKARSKRSQKTEGVPMDVGRGVDICPNCSSYLFWKKEEILTPKEIARRENKKIRSIIGPELIGRY